MTIQNSPTALEKVPGNVITQSALTALATMAGGPLAALLPILASSLAAERQKTRVQDTLAEIDKVLQAHEHQIRHLSDEQYKIVNEAILACLQTSHSEKLRYLRAAVRNAISIGDLQPHEATLLGRVLRDISADEAKFLLRTFNHEGILLFKAEGQTAEDKILKIDPASEDALVVSGLVSLGLLVGGQSTYGGPNVLNFTKLVGKLIALLKEPNA